MIDPLKRKQDKERRSRTITISKGDIPLSINITSPQPASTENDNISDADYALKILEKWDTENMFLLRENMELTTKDKKINADALRGLCLEYDLKYGTYPGYEGLSLLVFFLQTVAKTDILKDENETDTWKKQIAELKKKKEEKE